jgi:hypothetical protein
MPESPLLIQSITLAGFRAYLEPATFDLSQKLSGAQPFRRPECFTEP